MKGHLPVGLVVEGSCTDSAVLRLPNIADDLGPVKSTSLRVARRFSNSLRAGYAVADYPELQAARLILIRVPDRSVPRLADELSRSDLVFKDLSFVLCETWLMAGVLEPLRERGASIATLVPGPGRRTEWFVIEGQVSAVRQLRRFLDRNGARSFDLRPGSKPLYFAATLFGTVLPVPLLLAAQQALRSSGLSGNQINRVLKDMTVEVSGALGKGARAAWPGPLFDSSPDILNTYMTALRRKNPNAAELLDEQLSVARRQMGK